MSEAQLPENQIIQANNENKQVVSNINSLNEPNKELGRNNPTNNQENNEELKIGQYILTPLQSIILNQKMPFGFKLETEENILKSLETTKNQAKKYKNSSKHKEKGGRDGHRNGGMNQQRRKNQNMNNIDNLPSNATPEMFNLYKKCKRGLEKIKECRYAHSYYQSNNPDVPCLANIEKKVNNYEYKNLYNFLMDVRSIWGYYFKLQENNEITSKLSDEWEKICDELENQNNEMSVKNIKKRTEIIQKELDEYKDNGLNRENLPAPVKKNNQQNNEHNKPMTVDEKNRIFLIKNKIIEYDLYLKILNKTKTYLNSTLSDLENKNKQSLNKDQLKGIINILSENNPVPKSKYFEFDIDKLSTKKLRELEKYVKECLTSNNNTSNNTHNQNMNNKATNQKDNQNNKNYNSNKGNNSQSTNQNSQLKNNNKEINKTQENKEPSSAKKIKQNIKKNEKNNESLSESESISSDSSLSN